ncbi:hypothetical protein Tco_0974962 [Tanacetum coccineum]|uniref:Uncharacterized protein n=1 Tax=Tanacetum coccineum TaxID=301880 RepID=A0ABQ5ED19_9ASTR
MVWNKKATQPRRVEKGESSNAQNHKDKPATNPSKTYSSAPKADDIALKNSFSQLVENAEVEWGDDQTWGNAKHAVSTINESDSEEVDEDINLEEPLGQAMSHANKGNSVPHATSYAFGKASDYAFGKAEVMPLEKPNAIPSPNTKAMPSPKGKAMNSQKAG